MENYILELIIIISNRGFKDEIMETAKQNGARGGTILHGKSSGTKEAMKFFGISIMPEKDLILIVTNKETKNQIMQAVSEKHGVHTNARALCFSLPVTDAVGFNLK